MPILSIPYYYILYDNNIVVVWYTPMCAVFHQLSEIGVDSGQCGHMPIADSR